MGRITEKQRVELQSNYGDNAFDPIPSEYMEMARSKSARYILFRNKDNVHGYCQHCGKDVEFFKGTKYKEVKQCPNCGKGLIVMHTWRKPNCEWDVDWYVYGQLVDKNTFALRYIRVSQEKNYVQNVGECAREIYDFQHGKSYRFSNIESGWTVNCSYFFTEFNMYNRRKNCCIAALPINNIESQLKGMTAFKYFKQMHDYFSIYVYARDNISRLLDVALYEKLENVGLSKMSKEIYKDYHNKPKYKRKETSLLKMLSMDRPRFKLLQKYGTVINMNFMQKNKELSLEKLEYIFKHKRVADYDNLLYHKVKDPFKALKYIVNNKLNCWEYTHYISLLKTLAYNLDDAYLYPKDFRKADARVTNEWQAKKDEEQVKKLGKQSALMKKISDGLRNMPDLKEFLGGAKGLLVYIPESAKELLDEGRALHNCLSTYVDSIADGKTLVFFIRKLDTPNAPFVAFEYCNGEVVQCRYDYNENVEDDNIISFVDAFAERLRKNNVLYKAA